MKQIPIIFVKPRRGKNSCQSVKIEKNEHTAVCLRAGHIADYTSDETNGVLVIEDVPED